MKGGRHPFLMPFEINLECITKIQNMYCIFFFSLFILNRERCGMRTHTENNLVHETLVPCALALVCPDLQRFTLLHTTMYSNGTRLY